MKNEWDEIGNQAKSVSTSKLAVGAHVSGQLVELVEQKNTQFPKKDKEGNPIPTYNMLFEDNEGNEFMVYPSGNLNFMLQDGLFEVGKTYKITRQENTKTKLGNQRTTFKVERLRQDGSVAAPKTEAAVPKGKNA